MPDTNPNIAPGSLPTFSIPPYGVETFTDTERQLSFTTLHYRHGRGRPGRRSDLDRQRAEGAGGGGPAGERPLRYYADARRRPQHEDARQVALSPQGSHRT